MKIGLCTTSFPRFDGDVAGAFVLGFARSLAARGHELVVLAPEPGSGGPAPAWPGVDVIWLPYLRPRSLQRTFYGAGVPDNLRRDPRAWMGLAPYSVALMRRARELFAGCDALVSHWALPSALALGRVRGRRPHLAVLHSADVHALATIPLGRALARRVARGATSLLFASEPLRDRFLALVPAAQRTKIAGDCHVSAMGIDPVDADAPRRAARRLAGLDRFTVLSMGRLVPIKGIDVAIRAMAGRGGWELVVAGEGPSREGLARIAAQTGTRARFTGIVRAERKAALLRGADAFVLPSVATTTGREEGMPTALLEAMYVRLPVVASDTGGVRQIVTDGRNGLIVPPGDPARLSAALARIAGDARLRRRLGRAAHTVAKRYLWSELAPHIEAVLTA